MKINEKKAKKMKTVLLKVYQSGRPDTFRVVDSDDTEKIDRLVDGYGFDIYTETESDITDSDCWDLYTYEDELGFSFLQN